MRRRPRHDRSRPGCDQPDRDQPDRERVLERRLNVPVLIASVAAVPAVFLTALEGAAETAGMVVNWMSMAVLATEAALLFWVSGDRVRWLRTHWWMVAIVVLTIPAVIFTVGPAQVLRLLRLVTTIQLFRVAKLVRVAQVLRRRAEHLGSVGRAVWMGALFLALVFLGIVLADPSTLTRRTLETIIERWGWVVLLGLVLLGVLVSGAVILLVRRWRGRSRRARSLRPGRSQRKP
ncbi:hypothetical protein [Haloactinomyces albus]|uniref:Voltage-gated potassium channel n=1 Tax=Haloactinomyces albus TaxID=1352928 RepID=A0AAE3ZBJ8_9ACTN|nr:hypothetical protein [Haloactinomyces albus]MDR7300698.1 hypothetical protein [Haloactinomyces albus]